MPILFYFFAEDAYNETSRFPRLPVWMVSFQIDRQMVNAVAPRVLLSAAFLFI